ncbi:MAG: 50S ribosomal protein L11 methyltransferase [Acutalibacteraceae bacterium]|nr:50S ribosomal protein L11 methyltransferase [Acutalibacteraceae bacterium]
MNWSEIVIKIPTSQCEKASAIANMTVPYGIYIEDYSDLEAQAWEIAHIDLIDEELLAKDKNSAYIHIYIDESEDFTDAIEYLKERFNAENIDFVVTTGTVADIDWNEYWKKFFHTTEIGKRLAVVPCWEEYENPQNRKVLKINPGVAFGTGTHATTSLCLELLEEYVKDGMSVLDIGCGSGILAIAGVLLGSKNAVGVDIDEASVRVADDNAVMNEVENSVQFIHGDLAENVSGKYDIVCANIVADVIIRLLANVADYMNDSAVLIASGIIDTRADDVKKAFIDNGFLIKKQLRKDNWYAFAICKNG